MSSQEFITLQATNNLYWLLRPTLLTKTNYPKMNAKLIEHEKTKATAKNAVEVGIDPFIETGHTIFQLKEVWNFSKNNLLL